jgi:hypothetical protein
LGIVQGIPHQLLNRTRKQIGLQLGLEDRNAVAECDA